MTTLAEWISGLTVTTKSPPDGHEFYGNQYGMGSGGGGGAIGAHKHGDSFKVSGGSFDGMHATIQDENTIIVKSKRSVYKPSKSEKEPTFTSLTKNGKHVTGNHSYVVSGDKIKFEDAAQYTYDKTRDEQIKRSVESLRR